MKTLVQVDFEFHGPFGQDMVIALKEIAESINQEPGLIWKIWTENQQTHEGGGIYLFEDEKTATTYLEMHTQRLNNMGITDIRGKIFDVNETLSLINYGPINTGPINKRPIG